MNPHNTTQPYHQSLTHCILNIARLPAAPTCDWATQAAHALAPFHPTASLGVVIARHNTATNTLRLEAGGVHTTNQIDTLEARCPLERLGSFPINLSQQAIESGYIAPISRLLPQWFASKASLPWTSPHPNQTLLGYAPLHTINPPSDPNTDPESQTDPESLALLILACPHSIQAGPINPDTFSAALTALTHKATSAIHPDDTGTIPWLTQREQTILNHLIDGDSVRVIADLVDRSPHTVHDHVKNLHRKLGATSRGQLIARALGNNTNSEPINLIRPIIDQELTRTTTPAGVAELKPATPAFSQHPTAE